MLISGNSIALVRRLQYSRRLAFVPPVRCCCGRGYLTVIDHRAPWYPPTASREWRYEVTCDECRRSDPDGYQTRVDIIAAYQENGPTRGDQP